MEKYGVNQLRRMFLDFFESKGHLAMKSFSLVPHNDNSLLLINSGMAPLKPYFTGQEIPPRRRVCTCQKCIRTGDIENIGKTARHGTFFEMLGNFSFGDYFKKEAVTWSWEFLTEVVGLDPNRLYPSVYVEDDETFNLWRDMIGIPEEKIFRFGREDNFWEHGSGPCGPCTEIYYDRGEKYGCGKPDCTVGCECDRYIEVWNNVFSQFNNDGHGNYTDLVQKNIDTGMGLERLAVVVQDVDSLFTVDTNKALLDRVCELAGKAYQVDHETDVSIRIVTDHIKSCTFMISDGITPSNEGRGYVLRRLLRRAARHGRKLGIEGKFLANLSETVIALSKDGYPELEEKKAMIFKVLTNEEDAFNKTIDQGLAILAEMENGLVRADQNTLSGADAFKLYDTYGFPLDLTKEILEEKGLSVDEAGYQSCMKEQKETARKARKTTNYMGAVPTIYDEIPAEITSEFVGYGCLENTSRISVLTTTPVVNEEEAEEYGEITEAVADGTKATIIVDETCFYATMGGQEGDTGIIENENGSFAVSSAIHLKGGKIAHVGVMTRGMFTTGETVNLKVDAAKRHATEANHSGTHLLQKALRSVLGSHVEQKGSLVTPTRLRFDFTHFEPMTPEEIKKVEDMVNEKIMENLPIMTKVMGIEEARKTGAMALFGEKYGDEVRVVDMGEWSIELCGGTHAANTGAIGRIKIVSEAGISAGVRRIEALTGQNVFDYYAGLEKELTELAAKVRSNVDQLPGRIDAMQAELKALKAENEKLKAKMAQNAAGDLLSQVKEMNGIRVLAAKIEGVDMNGLRNLGDELKEKLGDCFVMLASELDGKVSLMATASDSAMKKGAHAGNLIKEIASLVGGGGGGRPNMAQAGGKNPSGIQAAIEKAYEACKNQLNK